MSTRISNLLLLALAGCGQNEEPRGDEDRIACARGNAPLARSCTVHRDRRQDGTVLTIRHPDGSFRRLLVTGDRVVAADGAEAARVRIDANGIDVALGEDRYRLPATVRGANAPR